MLKFDEKYKEILIMWPLLGYIDFRCFIILATMKNLPPVGANLTENDPRTPIFLFHFWNPDNFSNLYVKFEENLMDLKNGPNTVNVFKSQILTDA